KTFSTMAEQTMVNGACVEAANAAEPVCDTDEAYIYPPPPPPPPTPTPTPQCPDTYEPNGDFERAWVVVPGTYESYICCQSPQDSDYFGFSAGAGDQIEVWLTSLPANYELCLFDPDRTEVECSTQASTASEHIQHTAQQSGEYSVWVYGFPETVCDSGDPYTLRIEVTEPTPVPTATPTTGGIVACVWEDLNGNGERDTGEPGLQGVLLVVTEDGDDTRIIGTCSTGASGCCTFADLDPGTYTVTAGAVQGFFFTTLPSEEVEVSAGLMSQVSFGARQWFRIRLPVVFKIWQ
ncbi:MAG: pre-peptidase C-terminal domain-containing protein, partial [Anaerolineales bacterium]